MNHIRRYLRLYIFLFSVIAISFAVIFDAQINTFIGSLGDNNQQIQGPIIPEESFKQEIKEEQKTIEPVISSGAVIDQEEKISLLTEDKEIVIEKLIKSGYNKQSGSFQGSGEKIIGTMPISLAKNKKLPVSVILKSTNTLENKYAEVELPADIYVKNKNNTSYTKIIKEPKFIDPKEYNIDNKAAVSMIKVGSDDESLFFKNIQGKDQYVTIRMPAPGYSIGADANIYSSEDGENWNFHTTTQVQEIENSPYVVFNTNHFTLFTVGSIQWDNDNFLTEEFWNNNPTDEQIIRALYGDGSGGVERTAYTRYWTGVTCVTGDMSVVYLSGGTSKIPLNLTVNTIYILESGNYITTDYINMTGCSSIAGTTGNINLYSSGYLGSTTGGMINFLTGFNIVLSNLNINGTSNGIGGSHTANRNGLWLQKTSNSTFYKLQIYNNNYYSVHINSGYNNILENVDVYNNSDYYNGFLIYINGSNYNKLNNIKSYNSKTYGILLDSSKYNTLTNIQIYNNRTFGLYLNSSSNYNIFNNIQLYNNNQDGLYLNSSSNNTFNNIQSYNNMEDGIDFSSTSNNNVLNNIQSYNNLFNGIFLNSSSNNIIRNTYIKNNWIGISLQSSSINNKYYDNLSLSENNRNMYGISTGITAGLYNTYSFLGRTGGVLEINSGCFRCGNITNPVNIGSGSLTNTGLYRACNSMGSNSAWIPSAGENIMYIYGTSLPKQVQPVQYSGSSLIQSSLLFDSGLYIGEVNRVSTNNDTVCDQENCGSKYSITWNNDNFIDETFWSQNPNSCDIIAALYGTGDNGEDQTAYTINRSGFQNGNLCNTKDIRVFSGINNVSLIPKLFSSNSIYVIDSGNYILSGIVLNNCSVIISKNGISNFFSPINVSQMLAANNKRNLILQNISLDGISNGSGGTHTQDNYGFQFSYIQNSLLNNIKIYNHSYGIYTYYSNYIKINNAQIYNNGNGIYLGPSSNYNILNNIQSYNNSQVGIYFYGLSDYNVLNNIQSYNNGDGLYIASSNNVLNNVQVYNNSSNGIYLGASNNIIRNTYIKNNWIGISLQSSSINNKYYDNLSLSENNRNIDGISTGITAGLYNIYSFLGRTGGVLEINSGCFRCGNITNPVNIGSGSLTNTGLYRACNSMGSNSAWIPSAGENIMYIYGTSLPKQVQPVQYSGSSLIQSSLLFDSGLYIGEVNRVSTNDTVCDQENCGSKYSITWNNDNFIDETFWSQNPNSCDIIAALYGTGDNGEDQTAYTINRSGFQNGNLCNTKDIRVFSGINNVSLIPILFQSNSIYVIDSGNYMLSGIYLNNCSAIISKNGISNFFSPINVSQMLAANNKRNLILQNISLDGISNGLGGTHTKNRTGLFLNYVINGTLSNLFIHDNLYGINLNYSNYVKLGKSYIYNNSYGIYLNNSHYNSITNDDFIYNNSYGFYSTNSNYNNSQNIKIYNNSNAGIYLGPGSNYNILNNLIIYNNGVGIGSDHRCSYNVVNNSQIFNNNNGVSLSAGVDNNFFNNIDIYNNNNGFSLYYSSRNNVLNNVSFRNNNNGIYLDQYASSIIYYTNLNMINNNLDIIGSGERLLSGLGSTYSYLGRTTGEIYTGGIINRSNLVNVKDNFGNYLLSWTGSLTGMIGRKPFTGSQISYGYDVLRQKQEIIYRGSLTLTGEYDSNKYIGGDDLALTGILSGWNSTWHSSMLNLSYLANPGLGYNLFGDVSVTTSGEVNTPISLLLSQGTGTKSIIAQLFDGNSFTHFVFTSDYVDLPYVDLLDVQNQQTIENELINGGYQESTGSVQGIISGYFIGKKDIRLYYSDGELLVPVIMQSTGIELVEVQLSSGTIVKTEDNQPYTGIVSIPYFKDLGTSSLSGTLAVVSFGSENISLQLKDVENNPITAIIRIPVFAEIDEHMDIYYSENGGSTREFHTSTNVISLSGSSYVEFTTTHFTDFAIVGVGEIPLTGSFVINNDDEYTLTGNVTLSLDASGATHMRFSNDQLERTNWILYTGLYQWNLTGDYGTKIVYAEIDFDADGTGDVSTSDSILYSELPPGQIGGNITLEITGGATECVYGTSLNMEAQDVKIGIPYTFTGTFPSTWYCQDYRGIDGGWTLTIQTTDLRNENNNVISGSNLLISHDPVVVEGDLACTGYNGTATQFYSTPYEILEKIPDSKKICKVSADNVSLLVNVPANQAPGNYSGTLTLTMNGF